MKKLSPAERKEKQRQFKSLFGSSIAAILIIGLALISTELNFESLGSSVIFAGIIIAATLFVFFFIVRWVKGMDEFERQIASNASLVALYSSMLLLPWTFLQKIGFLPELNVHLYFMFMWFVFVCAIFYFHKNP